MSKDDASARFSLTFKRSTIVGTAIFALATSPAYSLALGDVSVLSGLNQKFQAEIDLGTISSEELNSLSVRVAPDADYQRANMEIGGVEHSFAFEVVEQDKDAVIQVTSKRLISEPLVVFLLEARWQRGRLLREYAIFLDPVDPDEGQKFIPRVTTPEVKASPMIEAQPEPELVVNKTPQELERERLRAPVASPVHIDALPELPYHYGPVRKGVSGLDVATELSRGTILTPEQMLMALFEANPVAFHGNINGLDAGFMLRIPDAVDISAINSDVAAGEILRHNASWKRHVANGGDNKAIVPPLSIAEHAETTETNKVDEYFDEVAEADGELIEESGSDVEADREDSEVDQVADADSSGAELVDASGSPDEAGGRLELVAPDEEEVSIAGPDDLASSNNAETASAEIEAAALRVENAKLREQLSKTESLLLDIRALLVARSDELADLKARISKLEGNGGEVTEGDPLEVFLAEDNSNQPSGDQGAVETGEGSTGGVGSDANAAAKASAKSAAAVSDASDSQTGTNRVMATMSDVLDGMMQVVISIGWIILLPLFLLLLIVVLFLARRRKESDVPQVTAASVDEVYTEGPDAVDDGLDSPPTIYTAPDVEVSAESEDDYSDDFVDELADDIDSGEDLDARDEFSNNLGGDIHADDPFDKLSVTAVASGDDLAVEDEFDIVFPDSDDQDLAVDTIAEVAEQQLNTDSTKSPDSSSSHNDHDDLLAFDAAAFETPQQLLTAAEMDATEHDMDFDLDDFEIAESESLADVATEMPVVDADVDLDVDIQDNASVADELTDIPSVNLSDDQDALDARALDDLKFDSTPDDSDVNAEATAAETLEESDVDTSNAADADIAAFAGGDTSNTKLDLAKAYIEMGDSDEARSLLEEVIAEADGAVKAEAEAALIELG